MHDYSAYVVTI